ELDVELPQVGWILSTQIGAQQVAPFAAARLAQLVAVEREAEGCLVGRHFDIDQTPCRSGSGARGAELHQQFFARDVLHPRDLLETRPQPLELTPPHGALLENARVALRQQVKLLVVSVCRRMRQQLDLDTLAYGLPR